MRQLFCLSVNQWSFKQKRIFVWLQVLQYVDLLLFLVLTGEQQKACWHGNITSGHWMCTAQNIIRTHLLSISDISEVRWDEVPVHGRCLLPLLLCGKAHRTEVSAAMPPDYRAAYSLRVVRHFDSSSTANNLSRCRAPPPVLRAVVIPPPPRSCRQEATVPLSVCSRANQLSLPISQEDTHFVF